MFTIHYIFKVFILVSTLVLLVADISCGGGDKCTKIEDRKECRSTPGCIWTVPEHDEFLYGGTIRYQDDCILKKNDDVLKDLAELFNDEW